MKSEIQDSLTWVTGGLFIVPLQLPTPAKVFPVISCPWDSRQFSPCLIIPGISSFSGTLVGKQLFHSILYPEVLESILHIYIGITRCIWNAPPSGVRHSSMQVHYTEREECHHIWLKYLREFREAGGEEGFAREVSIPPKKGCKIPNISKWLDCCVVSHQQGGTSRNRLSPHWSVSLLLTPGYHHTGNSSVNTSVDKTPATSPEF